ncbi:MAG: hypothetical protein J6S23_02220 [Clostridia bacterium]|nr:hypothetical protein [Clostridia bacterium]
MFGYVVVDKPSLRVREYDYYRATYCGLCHAMGKCTGCVSRLTLSYDVTFFALVREMLEETKVEFVKKRCPRHIIKPINTVQINPELEFSAFVGGILTSQKIVDNVNDEKGAKKFLARALRVIFSKMERESMFGLPDLYDVVDEKLKLLNEVEQNRVASIDVPADIFGDMMSSLLSFGLKDDKKLIAQNVGKRIGRWIYIVDAFDDYNKDRESGSYNPFVLLYDGEDFSEDNLISISKMLEAELSLAYSAIELIDDEDKNREEIVKNILCLGMPQSVKRVCDKLNKKDKD